MEKLWFSIYDRSAYQSTEQRFFKPEQLDWTKSFRDHHQLIRDELLLYLKENNLQSYFDGNMVSKKNSWKTISLKWWNIELFQNQKHFKKTSELIQKVPNLVSASFNLLEPHSKIKPHNGDTNGIYRCHLGLIIPEQLPVCGFRVEEQSKAWENGNWLIFIDALNHEAWNDSPHPRYILVVDVIRDEFASQKNFICSTVMAGLFFQRRAVRFPFLSKLGIRNQMLLVKGLRPLSSFAIHFRNFLSKLGLLS